MAWTKRALIREAFGALAIAGHTFDLTPEEMATALRRLEAMVAAWGQRGVFVGYNLSQSPEDADEDQDSGIPGSVASAVFLNLALEIAGDYGRAVPLDLRGRAKEAFAPLLRSAAMPPEQALRGLPCGAGSRHLWTPRVVQSDAWNARTYTAAAPIAALAAVALNAAGQAVPADCFTLAHAETTVGVARASAGAAQGVIVDFERELSGPWVFTPGLPVFVGQAGALVQALPMGALFARQIGVAVTTNRVLLELQQATYL